MVPSLEPVRSTKMGLEGASTEALARSKTDYETFLADPENLKVVREKLAAEGLTAEQRHVLEVGQGSGYGHLR